MRVFASRLVKTVTSGLATCVVLALVVGCETSGPGVGEPSKEGEVAVAKGAPPTAAEKRKMKGASRAASGAQPAGAQ